MGQRSSTENNNPTLSNSETGQLSFELNTLPDTHLNQPRTSTQTRTQTLESPKCRADLLALVPPEIRTQIYSHLLRFSSGPIPIYRVTTDEHNYRARYYHPRRARRRTSRNEPLYPPNLHAQLLPLFLTNKAISLESRTYFYSTNFFSVPDAADWPQNWERLPLLGKWFLERIGEFNRQALRHLRVFFPLDAGDGYRKWEASARFSEDGERNKLLPYLSSSCPNMTVLEFEARSSSHFESYLLTLQHPDARSETMAMIGQGIREEFPGLETMVINLYEYPSPTAEEDYPRWAMQPISMSMGIDDRARERMYLDLRNEMEEVGWTVRSAGPWNARNGEDWRVVFADGPAEICT